MKQSSYDRGREMNILFVTTDYPKRGQPTTGFPNYLYRVSLALLSLGHKPIILAAGDRDGRRMEQGIEIRTVRVSLEADFGSQMIDYAANALKMSYILNRKIKELTQEMPVDVIQFTSLYGIAVLYYGKTPAVLRLSSYAKIAFPTFETFSEGKIKTMSLLERLSAGRCQTVFAPCQNTADAFAKDCRRRVTVVETPFVNDVQEYDTRYLEENLRDKKYVLFFGAMYLEKGILVIADILERFLSDYPDHHFVFIGKECKIDGEGAARIIRRKAGKCADRVIVSSAMPHDCLYPVISHAEFVVLPSYMENMSNACIEAMYFERVVIGTDGASFEQLITHGQNGLLCQIGSSEDLLEKMRIAVSMTEEEKKQMGRLAKRRIGKLRPEYAVQRLVRLYEYVIENSKNK